MTLAVVLGNHLYIDGGDLAVTNALDDMIIQRGIYSTLDRLLSSKLVALLIRCSQLHVCHRSFSILDESNCCPTPDFEGLLARSQPGGALA